jgi:hypothetical protein
LFWSREGVDNGRKWHWLLASVRLREVLGSNGFWIVPGKRVQIDDETWQALTVLAKDQKMNFQKLSEEAFADLLPKHNRPTTLKAALRQSARAETPRDSRKRRS